LETSLETGLTKNKAQDILARDGENTLTERNKVPWYVVFLKEQTGFFSLLLWLGAALCFIAYALADYQEKENPTGYLDPSNLYLGIVLATVVFITGCFSYLQTSKAASLMDDFKNFIPRTAQVLRDGKWEEIESKGLAVGDVI
jgi:sodium/potassium-transporting ATPase subunit alpha